MRSWNLASVLQAFRTRHFDLIVDYERKVLRKPILLYITYQLVCIFELDIDMIYYITDTMWYFVCSMWCWDLAISLTVMFCVLFISLPYIEGFVIMLHYSTVKHLYCNTTDQRIHVLHVFVRLVAHDLDMYSNLEESLISNRAVELTC